MSEDIQNNEGDINNTPENTTTLSTPKKLTYYDILMAVKNGYSEKPITDGVKECTKSIQNYLKQILGDYPTMTNKYNIVVLNDSGRMVSGDADNIYSAVTSFDNNNGNPKPILLILYSNGGIAGAAYLIGKLCLEFSNNNFIVSVPRHAKSAATLLCCAAREIHMGSLSELGPIDPQIKELPALGLKNAIQHIAELVKSYPEASLMFANYLYLSLPLIDLGYYERAAESNEQYAEQLLITHKDSLPQDAKNIAHDLVYKYKDHGFVIEKMEAKKIFGDIIKTNTKEYELGNEIYEFLDFVRTVANAYNNTFYFIGSVESEPTFKKKATKKKED